MRPQASTVSQRTPSFHLREPRQANDRAPTVEAQSFANTLRMTLRLGRIVSAGLLLVLSVGCASNQPRIGVLERGEHDYMFIQGDGQKQWYSALELRKIAEQYVREKKIDYPISDAAINIWVYTDKRKPLAEVWFTQGVGQPTLGIDIDRYGRVMRHRMGIGIDRMTPG